MSKMVTVEQLAEDSGIPLDKLLERLKAAGLGDLTPAHEISEDERKKLLGSVRGSSISLRRQKTSALKLSGGQGKTVQVKVVKQRRYVKKPEAPVVEEEEPIIAVEPEVSAPEAETPTVSADAPETAFSPEESVIEETADDAVAKKAKKTAPKVENEKPKSVADQQAAISSSDKEAAGKPKKSVKPKKDKQTEQRKTKLRVREKNAGRYSLDGMDDGGKRRRRRKGHRDVGGALQDKHGFSKPLDPMTHDVLVPETISVADLAQKDSVYTSLANS